MDFTQFFEPSSEQEWKDKILKDLKGGSLEDLVWQSEIGPVDPVLFNYEKKFGRIVPKPDQEDNSWEIAASFDCTHPTQANKAILEALMGGVNHIRLYNCTADSLGTVLKDVMLDIISTTVFGAIETSQEEVLVTNSPLSATLKTGNQVTLTGDHFTVNGSYLADLGVNLDHQLGMMIGMGHDYLIHLMEQGVSAEEAAGNIHFEVGIGNSYFAEIAKIGALRLLWNTLLTEYGVEDGYAVIHARTSNFNYSNLDIHNNQLRATTAAMAASISGVESIEVLPYDLNLSEKFSDGSRLAKNVQLLLQEESYFNQVKDAAAGSYYIEQLTDILIEKGWAFFQEIDKAGSFQETMKNGMISQTIQSDIEAKKKNFAESQIKLVGVNFQPNAADTRTEEAPDSNVMNANRLAQFNV
ncbi:MAG: hypothetical protein H6599_07170 [Flavobacteriales bacterium]|nr:hypothetical protein [Flavobacteriales bacterium]